MTTYHTHWAAPGNSYIVDANLDFADSGWNAVSTNGPSPGDYEQAKTWNLSGLLIDRTSTYYYGYSSNNFATNFGGFFSMRYLPFYFLPTFK